MLGSCCRKCSGWTTIPLFDKIICVKHVLDSLLVSFRNGHVVLAVFSLKSDDCFFRACNFLQQVNIFGSRINIDGFVYTAGEHLLVYIEVIERNCSSFFTVDIDNYI